MNPTEKKASNGGVVNTKHTFVGGATTNEGHDEMRSFASDGSPFQPVASRAIEESWSPDTNSALLSQEMTVLSSKSPKIISIAATFSIAE